jgi:hypothetical protein
MPYGPLVSHLQSSDFITGFSSCGNESKVIPYEMKSSKNIFASDSTLARMDDSRFGFIVLVLEQNGFVLHLFGNE